MTTLTHTHTHTHSHTPTNTCQNSRFQTYAFQTATYTHACIYITSFYTDTRNTHPYIHTQTHTHTQNTHTHILYPLWHPHVSGREVGISRISMFQLPPTLPDTICASSDPSVSCPFLLPDVWKYTGQQLISVQ